MTPDDEHRSALPRGQAEAETNPSQVPIPIDELAGLPDFPQCALGKLIDIKGYAGVVEDIVKNSIKVRSPEGTTQSFNFHRLRTLYSPVVHPEPAPSSPYAARPKPVLDPAKAPLEAPEPKRDVIAVPDFSAPVKPIQDFTRRLDFPKCVLGQHVEVAGFRGVVVEILNQSLKVRSVEGVSRSYNAVFLHQLHLKP